MNEFQRAVAPTCYGVHVCLHKDVVQCVINRLLSCPCDVVFVSGALRWVAAKKVTTPSGRKKATLRSGTPGRSVGEVEDVLKADGCPTVRAGTRGAQCVYVPYVLSASLEFQRAVAPTCYGVHVCLHKDVVQCVINRLLSCPCDVVFVSRALRWVAAKKVTTPPSPKGQQPASRHTRHLLPTSRTPMQKGVPDC